jgi:RNA polymerase sigma factor (sigma-70 family)
MLDITKIQNEIIALMPLMRRTVAKVLRSSRYYSDSHIEECMGDIMLQAVEYGARTFDPSKGSAKSHFTTFAKSRAINWLQLAHRRFESVSVEADASVLDHLTVEADPLMLLMRARESARIRAAFASLEESQRALLAAFERTHCWGKAAEEIGVSAATASRMKAKIADALRSLLVGE